VEMEDLETPMFKKDCVDCDFCSGLREEDVKEDRPSSVSAAGKAITSFRAKEF
jgi:arsenite transporter